MLACVLLVAGCDDGQEEPEPSSLSSTTQRTPRSTSSTTPPPPVIVGSGSVASETRQVGGFTAVALDLPASVDVVIGDAPAVTLRADDNLLGAITTDVVDGELTIGSTTPFSTESEIAVEVVTPSLDRVEVRGSGSVQATGVSGPSFDVSVRGSGSVKASGSVESLDVTSAGSGTVELFELDAEEADVNVNGSGDVEVTVSRSLRAKVTGSGTVVYDGDPSEVVTDVDGSGSIPPR